MRYHSNIEPSAFKRGCYVGYGLGVWHIRRAHGGWAAIRHDDNGGCSHVSRRSLFELNAYLAALNESEDRQQIAA